PGRDVAPSGKFACYFCSPSYQSRQDDVAYGNRLVPRDGRCPVSDAVLAEGLVKTYGSVRALDGLDLAVPEGSVLALLGPNGAGKTTAVRVLTTLLQPDSGRAEV